MKPYLLTPLIKGGNEFDLRAYVDSDNAGEKEKGFLVLVLSYS